MQTCFVCHQPNGQGLPGQIPPLALSDFLATKDKGNIIRGVISGRSGPIVVNGKPYNGTMIPLPYLTDEQIANVLTYVGNSWGELQRRRNCPGSRPDSSRIRAGSGQPL